MKPYLLHKTWIDLDHVLGVESEAVKIDGHLYRPTGYFQVGVHIMFRDDVLVVELGDCTLNQEAGLGDSEQQKCLDAFIAAWKAKDLGNYSPAWLFKDGTFMGKFERKDDGEGTPDH